MFSAKDRMNYRYFHKRAHYLAVINKALTTASKKGGPLSGVKARWGTALLSCVLAKVGDCTDPSQRYSL
jgi:U3 small nucleolar RNA-associated protein 22